MHMVHRHTSCIFHTHVHLWLWLRDSEVTPLCHFKPFGGFNFAPLWSHLCAISGLDWSPSPKSASWSTNPFGTSDMWWHCHCVKKGLTSFFCECSWECICKAFSRLWSTIQSAGHIDWWSKQKRIDKVNFQTRHAKNPHPKECGCTEMVKGKGENNGHK